MSASRRFATSPRRLNYANSCVFEDNDADFPVGRKPFSKPRRSTTAIAAERRAEREKPTRLIVLFPRYGQKFARLNQVAERLGVRSIITPGDGLFYFQEKC